MTAELKQLCMKAESLRVQLISLNNGRYVHEACSIANILCNGVPSLEHGCKVIDDLEHGIASKEHSWTLDEATEFVIHVEKMLRDGVERAVKFLAKVEKESKL